MTTLVKRGTARRMGLRLPYWYPTQVVDGVLTVRAARPWL